MAPHGFSPSASVNDAVVRRLPEARRAWPTLEIDPVVFAGYVAARVADDPTPAQAVEALRLVDLYLACGCATGTSGAAQAFRASMTTAITSAARRIAPEVADDVCQQVMERLLVGEAPQISKYSGRGKLTSWLMTFATRHAQSLRRKQSPVATSDDVLSDRAVSTDDPELAVLKKRYRKEFKEAFQQAFSELEVRQRNMLRHEFIDGLEVEHIGKMYGVHRATIARWRAETRQALLANTRRYFQRELAVSQPEMDSIYELIDSQLDVSLSRLLRRSE